MSESQFQALQQLILGQGVELKKHTDDAISVLRVELKRHADDAIDALRVELKTHISKVVSAVRIELKAHTSEVVQVSMKTIGEHIEVFEADYKRTKDDHELRLLRLEQSTA